jgi:hypothetical protein
MTFSIAIEIIGTMTIKETVEYTYNLFIFCAILISSTFPHFERRHGRRRDYKHIIAAIHGRSAAIQKKLFYLKTIMARFL